VDESGVPLPGVLITITGNAGSKTDVATRDGSFIFPYMTPGIYSLKAELQGFGTVEQEEVVIRLGQRTEISFVMKAGLQETITVEGASIIDTTSTTTGMNITDEMLGNLPIGRTFVDAINLSPGVTESGLQGNPSISGASALENTYIVDGVNITNPGFGAIGGFGIKYGSLGSGFPIDMVKEIQVKTAGFEPEFGEALGGVVNVITKSGGNQFQGTLFSYSTPLEGNRERLDFDESLIVHLEKRNVVEGGLELSGPILKDKLFFYGAYNPRRTKTTFLNDPDASGFEDFPEASITGVTHSYAIKLISNLTSNHSLEFSAFGDPSSNEQGFQQGLGLTFSDPALTRSGLEFGTHSQTGRWTGILSQNMFVEAQVANTEVHLEEILSDEGNAWRYRDVRFIPIMTFSGGVGGYEQKLGSNLQYSLKLTNLWKTHQFRYGLQLQEIDHSGGFLSASGPTFTAFNGQQTSTGATITIGRGIAIGRPDIETIYFATSFITDLPAPSKTDYLNWFVQDNWNVTPFLNLQLGIRWESQQMKGDTQNAQDITFSNNWAPRIGATYDYLQNGKSKAFFHYGRFYEKIPAELAASFLNETVRVTSAYFDAGLTQPIPNTGNVVRLAGEVEGHGNSSSPFETKSQFSDEWVGGIEQEIRSGFHLGARFVYRSVDRVLEDIALNLDAPCIPISNGACVPPGLTFEETLNPATIPHTVYIITNLDGHYPGFPELTRKYKALEITSEIRWIDNWAVLGSYRYAHLTGNYEGLFHRESGQSAPNTTITADFANSPLLGFAYEEGPLPNDIRHTVKLFSWYQWNDLNTGIGFKVQSGRPISAFRALLFNDHSSLPDPRGSAGRTDWVSSFDLHADYTIHLRSADQRVTFGLDVLNVFNSQATLAVKEVFERLDIRQGGFLPSVDFLKPAQFQEPRTVRFLVRYSF
jgi:hypothetical protein